MTLMFNCLACGQLINVDSSCRPDAVCLCGKPLAEVMPPMMLPQSPMRNYSYRYNPPPGDEPLVVPAGGGS